MSDEPLRRLSDAIRDVKNAAADRDDVVVEMREAQRMRLELLVQELQPIIAEVPDDDAGFDFTISSGLHPRFWIDATSHVSMGRDRRTYRFLRETRLGRVVLAESNHPKPVADQVTRYIAGRIVERQRMMEGAAEPAMMLKAAAVRTERILVAVGGWNSVIGCAVLIALGALAGWALTLLIVWDRLMPVPPA